MKKNKFVTFLIFVGIAFFVSFIGAGLIRGEFNAELLSSTEFLLIIGVFVILALVPLLKNAGKNVASGSDGVGKTKAGDKISQYYDSRFITENELLHTPKYRYNTWNTLKNEKQDGIIIRYLYKSGKLNINFAPETIHTMIIGTTGSGKTSAYIEPSIRVFAQMGAKPCMVITDPKGELFNNHSIYLKESGYNVVALDLRKPYESTKWNPMQNAYDNYHKALKLEKDVKIHKGDNPADHKLKIISKVYNHEWFEYDGVAYNNREVLDNDLAAKKQIMIDEAENELKEIASTIVTIEDKHDPTWERGGRDFLFGVMLAMLEDSLKPEETGMTKEKFNFYNVGKMITYKDPPPTEDPYTTIREYCMTGRNKFSKVGPLCATCISNAPNTIKSYMGVLQSKISIFQDMGIAYATCENELNFDKFTDVPTALFIKVPDEKENRHSLATLCVAQLYKRLIDKANKSAGLKLGRPVHFLLDEFANLPKIEKMESLITVGRSRRIFFHLVIQSYSQLDNKYGKEAADIIRGNCNIQIYIGTDDQKTKEDFSKLCGDISLTLTNVSQSKQDKKDEGNSKTTSTQVVTRPLIIPYELGLLPKYTIVVKMFQENPIKTEFTRWFQVPFNTQKKAEETYTPAKPLDEERLFFDMKARNRSFNKKRDSFDW